MRRHDVASTLKRRCFKVVYLLGCVISCFVIISEGELVALLICVLRFMRVFLTVIQCLFLMVLSVGLRVVVVAYLDHTHMFALIVMPKVSKGAKIRNRYNQVPHLTQDTNGKVTDSQ